MYIVLHEEIPQEPSLPLQKNEHIETSEEYQKSQEQIK